MKEFFVSVLVVVFVLGVVVYAIFPPKVYITFVSVSGSSLDEKHIKGALFWQYRYNPLRIGKEYQVNMGSAAPITSPSKQNYKSFVLVNVEESGFLVDKTKTEENKWKLVLAEEKNGSWKIVGDKIYGSKEAEEWY